MSRTTSNGREAVAIIGLACRVPGAKTPAQFWENVRQGVESITLFTEAELEQGGVDRSVFQDPAYVRAAGVLEDVERFDEAFFGILPRDAAVMDPQQRLFLECAWEALEHGGYDSFRFAGLIGVYAGMGMTSYLLNNLRDSAERSLDPFLTKILNDKDYVSTRVSYLLDLKGPGLTVQTACSTSLVAVHLACQALLTHQCDMALAGGVTVNVPHHVGYRYSEGMILSPDGRCRAFDARAAGTVPGSGAGIVLLKRLSEAIRDGDTIHAVVKGSAINNDGAAKVGFTAPGVDGQADVIAMAQAVAGVEPGSIGLIEAHGTGTALGDPIEVAALQQAFGDTGRTGYCGIGSVKSNVGHLDAAAGVVSLLKGAMALEHGVLPPTLHFATPNPAIDFAHSPFFVVTEARPWKRESLPRRAGVSSFGLGGTNAHVVLEEPPARPEPARGSPWQLITCAAKTEPARKAVAELLSEHIERHPDLDLADVAYTLQIGRRGFRHRSFAVCKDRGDAISSLRGEVSGRLVTGVAPEVDRPVAFLFPGGGAQYPGMAAELYRDWPVFRRELDGSLAMLDADLAASLRRVFDAGARQTERSIAHLARPSIGLPALFTVEYALARLWMSWGVQPDALIGHSMGEYTAACLAGVFSLEDALRLVTARARLFERLPDGSMLSVPMGAEALSTLLPGDVSIAAINASASCVVSGAAAAIARFERALADRGIDAVPVPIAVAAHSHLVDPILDEFRDEVSRLALAPPRLPLVSNVTGSWMTAAEWGDPEYWVKHLRHTVRFADGIARVLEAPERACLEVGPGRALATLTRQHPAAAPDRIIVSSLRHRSDGRTERAALLEAMGRLWVAGASLHFEDVWQEEPRRRVPLPTYPFERKRHWIEADRTMAPAAASRAVITAEDGMDASTDRNCQDQHVTSSRREMIVRRLQTLLHDLSGLDVGALDPCRTFLELGFESLFLTQATLAFRREFGIRITFRQLLESLTTLDAVARHLDAQLPSDARPDLQPTTACVPAAAASVPEKPIQFAADPGSSKDGQIGAAAGDVVERVMTQQLQAFSELVNQQLQALWRSPSASTMAPPLDAVVPKKPTSAAPSRTKPYTPYEPLAQGTQASLTARQQEHLDRLIARYTARTARSKQLTAQHRTHLADPRTVAGFRSFWKEMVYPTVSTRASGSRIWDVDGNESIDLVMGYGVNLFGHSPQFVIDAVQDQLGRGFDLGPQKELAGQVAALVSELTGLERVTFCNTGSEAVLAALRAARTVTGRTKIAMFAGSYHGLFDEVLARNIVVNGREQAVPVAPGIPRHMTQEVMVLPYGEAEALDAIRAHAGELAAVLVEPVQSRQPDVQPADFLRELRALTTRAEVPLIFDEMITGFRIHQRGAQAWFGVEADIATYGKVVGGGLPIGIVAGKALYMDAFDGGQWSYGDQSGPEANLTYYAGTFVRHPLALASAWAVLNHLKSQGPGLQETLNERTSQLVQRLNASLQTREAPIRVVGCGSLFRFQFNPDLPFGNLLFFHLREKGIETWDRFNCFLSTAHTAADIDAVARAVEESVDEMREGGFLPDAAGGQIARRHRAEDAQPPISATRRLPLTEAQTEIWASTLMGTDASSAFNESNLIHFRGSLNVVAIDKAVQALVDRHDAFRMTLDSDGTGQTVVAARSQEVPFSDCSSVTAGQGEQSLDALVQRESTEPFDLVAGPLLRTRLIRLASDHHILVFTFHHIVCDGWSFGVVLEELRELYAAACGGRRVRLSPARQFGEFVSWAAESARGDASQDQTFWIERFKQLPPVLELPLDRPRPGVRTHRGAQEKVVLDERVGRELRAMGAQHGSSVFVTMLAAFGALLHRLAGQTDLVVGIPAAGQPLLGAEALVGHCTNLLPLRISIDGDDPFSRHLTHVRQIVLDAYEHQNYTFGSLVRAINPARDSSRLPIVEAIFNLDTVRPMGSWNGLDVAVEGVAKQFITFDLSLNCVHEGDRIGIECNYNADLFDRTTIQRWLSHLSVMLDAVVSDNEAKISRLPLLTAAERTMMVTTWNATARAYPRETVADLVEAQVARTPEAEAVRFEGATLTYRALDARANQLARRLQAAGVGPEVRVGVCLERSLDLVVALLAVVKAGGAFVPLEPAYPPERLQWLAADAAAPVVITEQRLAARLALPAATCVLALDREAAALAALPATPPARPGLAPAHLAYVLYTSGSTGTPKGAGNTHRGLCNRLRWMQETYPLTAADAVLQKTPIGFDVSVWEFFWPLLAGARLVVARPDGHRDPLYLTEVLAAEAITIVHFVPAMLQLWLETPAVERCTALRHVLCSGEALSGDLQRRFFARSPAALHNLYGPTEAAIDVTAWACRRDDPRPTVPIGRPVANTQIYLLDPHGAPVPLGVPGELHIGGVQVARGYLHQPALTAARFVPDPFAATPGATLYKTGDRARYLPDGAILFEGRLDQQLKLRGMRIEPQEIEAAIRRDPAVRDVAVVLREDVPGDKRLVAYVVAREEDDRDAATSAHEIDAWQSEEIAHWEKVYASAIGEVASPDDRNGRDPVHRILDWTDVASPVEETEEWVDQNVRRILALKPSKVLEIGCGTGLTLMPLAPHCSRYVATDLSQVALDYISDQASAPGSPIQHVELLQRAADDLSGFEQRSFDTVVLSSVVQYFPSVEYLVDVLQRLSMLVEDGGAIFIADVQHHGLFDAFLASIQLQRSADAVSTATLRERLRKRRTLRNPLTVAPELFEALAGTTPRIGSADVHLRRGRAHNQPTTFHYDVVLTVGVGAIRPVVSDRRDWQKDRLTLRAVESLLAQTPSRLAITSVPNARTLPHTTMIELLNQDHGLATAGELRVAAAAAPRGVDPEELWTLAERKGCAAAISWSAAGPAGSYDVIFARGSANEDPRLLPILARQRPVLRAWHHYANDPQHRIRTFATSKLRARLAQQLPDYMVPSAFVSLASLPLMPSGKLDRRALPTPDATRMATSRTLAPPTTATEVALAGIWADVLNVEQVGLDDDIFELGGDSLLIFRITVKANEIGFRLTPRDLFAQRTIRGLTSTLENDQKPDPSEVTVVEAARRAPKPEDFPLAKLNRAQLDRMFATLAKDPQR